MNTETPTYEHLLQLAAGLNMADQLRLLERLASLVRHEVDAPPSHDVRDLRGLGKDVWQGIDAQQYVDHERSTWDGRADG